MTNTHGNFEPALTKAQIELLKLCDEAKEGNSEVQAYLNTKYSLRIFTTQELDLLNKMLHFNFTLEEAIKKIDTP